MDNITRRIPLTKNPISPMEVDLLEAQKNFFRQFVEEGFEELFDEINPVEDYTGSNWTLSFEDVEWGKSKLGFREAQRLGQTYDAPIYIVVKLVNKRTGEIKKQKIFICDMPIMSERASFMVNGNEKVVVFQIIRSEGVLFSEAKNSTPAKKLYSVKLMPTRGKWYEFEVNKYGVMSVKLLEKRPRILLTTLLRALGYSSNAEIKKLLDPADSGEFKFVDTTLKKDVTKNTEEALIDIYRKLRPEDAVTLENAKTFLEGIFFNKRKFYLGKVGRYKLNSKLKINEDIKISDYTLKKSDLIEVIKSLIKLNNGTMLPDDIDSLSNRRIRGINELVSDRIRAGVLIMEKNIRDKMSTFSPDENVTPVMLVNARPIMSAVNQFFGTSALLRFMDQENILSELEAKRKITAGGPRGLTKERATFSVRDVHNSHYSKLCPVETPEGPSVGMVNQLAIYSKINEYGFLEAPYFKVVTKFNIEKDKVESFKGRYLNNDLVVEGKTIAKVKDAISSELITKASKAGLKEIPVNPFISRDELIYLDADEELEHKIASASVQTDNDGNILEDTTYIRDGNAYSKVSTNLIDFVDISPSQIAGLGLALIPFSGNDDPNRTLIGSKTQNQAIPLVKMEPPIVGTGFEKVAVKATGRAVFAEEDGTVLKADENQVLVQYTPKKGENYISEYEVEKFSRTNQNTSFSQTSVVLPGQKVKKGDVLIDGASSVNGELALGTNLRTAFIVFDGYNYEDGIVISERLVKEDLLTSVHIKEYTQEIRETKLGDEELTRDIPGAGERALRHLDEDGLVRIGARVEAGDILAGIIAPKGEKELTAEEKLLRALFGEYARDVRDNSLKVPYGEYGVVIGVQILDRSKGAKLNAGVNKQVKVWVAKTHKISVGDKLTGFHGDKGVITKILPEEDMPHTEDGKPVDVIIGPTSMVRRMNLGMLIEAHVSQLASQLGVRVEVQPFSEYSLDPLLKMAEEKGVKYEQKVNLYDGRTGRKFNQKTTIGYKYFFKLDHLSDHKVHARSTGPYTLVTQQPLRGKAQRGGRRFGEMEVWALEAHAVPTVLHEMLTIKSDDVVGRAAAYKSITTGRKIETPRVPESFNVLDKELAGLAIKLDKVSAEYDLENEDKALQEIVDQVGEDVQVNN
jgi:DNA-directed RNA polymerase subunit beta